MSVMPNTSPVTAWKALKEGNERFVAGQPAHPSQSIADRARLAHSQKPTAVLFGCADSRVAAEIIFDQGLGDMFVVRTAGHVIDPAVLGSIEYAVTILNVPLIVVLGHDSCGAVKATLAALDSITVATGLVFSGDDLREQNREYLAKVEEQVAESEELSRMLRGLEDRYDAYMAGSTLATPIIHAGDLPSADELAAELERFLASRPSGDEDKRP